MLAAHNHASGRVFSQTPNVCEIMLLQDGCEVGPGCIVSEGTVTEDNGAVTDKGERVPPPVGDAKGWQRDGLPGRSRLFSDTLRYGAGGQEGNAIGEGRSGHRGTALGNPRLTML